MELYEAIRARRSIRKFKQQPVPVEVLTKLVDAARLAAQGSNMQPMKYLLVHEAELLDPIFSTTRWAGAIAPQGNPADDERPMAYIVVLVDTEVKKAGYDVDAGAAVENLLLAAVAEGIGACWLGALERDNIRAILNIPERYVLHTMVALGYPAESPLMEEEQGSIKYYKDEQGVLHVPKRKLQDIIFHNRM